MSEHEHLELSLPTARWDTVEPSGGMVFVAERKGNYEWFRPNITADMAELQASATLADVAANLFQRLATFDPDARALVDVDGQAEGRVMQRVRFSLHADGLPPLPLEQWQVVVELSSADDGRRFALALMLTSEEETIDEYALDFQSFVRSATVEADA